MQKSRGPRGAPKPPIWLEELERWKRTGRHTGTHLRASGDAEGASQPEEAAGMAGSGEELSC